MQKGSAVSHRIFQQCFCQGFLDWFTASDTFFSCPPYDVVVLLCLADHSRLLRGDVGIMQITVHHIPQRQ